MRLAQTIDDFPVHPGVGYKDLIWNMDAAEQAQTEPSQQFSEAEQEIIDVSTIVASTMSFADYRELKQQSEANGEKLRLVIKPLPPREPTVASHQNLDQFTSLSPAVASASNSTTAKSDVNEEKPTSASPVKLGFALTGAVALSGLGVIAEAPPAVADSQKMSDRQIVEACHDDVRFVTHKGTVRDGGGSKGPAVNTARWYKLMFKQHSAFVEGDERPTVDGGLVALHDDNLATETTGSGYVHSRPMSYVKKQRTTSGDPIATPMVKARLLKKYHKAEIIEELKNEHNQWTPAYVQKLVDTYSKAEVLDQVAQFTSDSPAALAIIQKLNIPTPTALIGPLSYLPNPYTAVKVGAKQVNVSHEKALRPYHGYRTYIDAVHDTIGEDGLPLQVSIRSNPNGKGDDPRTITKEIEAGVDQLVVQQLTEGQVCAAVANYLKHGREAKLGKQIVRSKYYGQLPTVHRNHTTHRHG